MPAGDYAIWVHGWQVEGEGSRFDLRIEQLGGQALSVREAPARVAPDETVSLELCVDARAMRDVDAPREGLLMLSTGSAPRHILLPIDWRPGERIERPLYLPALLRAAGLGRD